MIVGYKEKFPWGDPTDFEKKILASQIPNTAELLEVVPKIHTIRKDESDRWHRARQNFLKIHHTVHVRQKTQRTFWINECTGIQDMEITWEECDPMMVRILPVINSPEWHGRIPRVYIDSIEIGLDMILQLAKNDGFNSTTDFFRWFHEDFAGKIIHWTDFRYPVDAKKVEDAYKVSVPTFSNNDLQTLLNL